MWEECSSQMLNSGGKVLGIGKIKWVGVLFGISVHSFIRTGMRKNFAHLIKFSNYNLV